MKKILCFFFIVLGMKVTAQDIVVNDANAQKRTVNAAFTAIQVSDGIELMLVQGTEESIAVSASDPKYMERFRTEVQEGVLKIYYDNKAMIWNSNEKRKLRAYVSFININRLKASSGAEVIMKSILAADQLQMSFSSGAHFNGEVNIGSLEVSQNSGSEINTTGRAENLKTDLSSGAIFKGFDLAVNFCEAKASSGAEVSITVNKELAAKANSGGSIRYRGDGVVKDINVHSGGSVKRS